MIRHQPGTSLLEVVIAGAILAAIAIPTFQLFSMQRHQVASTQREVFMHAHVLQRLAEEESHLAIRRFASGRTASVTVRPQGEPVPIHETLSVAPAPSTTGLWTLTVEVSYPDESARGALRSLAISKLVVDRDLATRLPAAVRRTP